MLRKKINEKRERERRKKKTVAAVLIEMQWWCHGIFLVGVYLWILIMFSMLAFLVVAGHILYPKCEIIIFFDQFGAK